MFERYTEKARRTIFFARYEASQYGGSYIETEHLLLGLLREDTALANRFLPSAAQIDSIREQIEAQTPIRKKASTAVDLPLSHPCKRVLAYGAEEAERMGHKHIGPAHLLLGLLREEKSFAAQLLRERGLTLDSVREQVRQSEAPPAQGGGTASFARLDQWLAEREAGGGVRTVRHNRAAKIYAGDQPKESEPGREPTPGEKLTEIQKRIDFLVERMEGAIANHEFEKARFYSDEERKERENLRSLRVQFNLEEPPPRIPLLCIEIIRDEGFSQVLKRCDDNISEGVSQVWLLDPNLKRAYTVTTTEGLREFKGEILQLADPPLEMDLRTIFD
jgi:ATP-dependent Clp protease ATP-binding subunit ClpA